jgi:hypothetical protein
MIDPLPCFVIYAEACFIARNTLITLILRVRMNSSGDIPTKRKPPGTPAFAKNISSLPYFETVSLELALKGTEVLDNLFDCLLILN